VPQPQSCPARQYRDQSQTGVSLPCETRSVGSDVLIAWDASSEIVSTLETFLSQAGKTETFTFAPLHREAVASARDAAAWLTNHGMSARVCHHQRGEPAAKTLYATCCATLPRLCLMRSGGCC
jgi:hypothetical protein